MLQKRISFNNQLDMVYDKKYLKTAPLVRSEMYIAGNIKTASIPSFEKKRCNDGNSRSFNEYLLLIQLQLFNSN